MGLLSKPAYTRVPESAGPWTGPRWEYASTFGDLNGGLQDRLAELGGQGWEAYATSTLAANLTAVLLKRPLPPA